MSQLEVSKLINCSRATLSSWENDDGEIPLSKLLDFLTIVNTPLTEFFEHVKTYDPDNEGLEFLTKINLQAEFESLNLKINQINTYLLR